MRSLSRAVFVSVGFSLIACTSTRMVQRDGCWLKRTEGAFGSNEQLGFCSRPQQPPAQDRVARLVQECMAQSDHRWENQALAAWNQNRPIPPQANDAEVVRMCMQHVSAVLGLEAENTALKQRLADLGQDREQLRTASDRDRQFIEQNSDKMVTALGEAAKKPAPAATATATVKSETDVKGQQSPPQSTVVGFAPSPAPAPVIVNQQPPQILQAPSLEVPVVQPVPAKPSSSCTQRKLVKKADGSFKDVPACELPAKPFAG